MSDPVTAPRETGGEGVDGAYEAFRERVSWFYKNAPECQEARKHSFSRQADVAFTLALNERLATPRPVEVTEEMNRLRALVESEEHWFACRSVLSEDHIDKGDGLCDCDRGKMLATLDRLTAALRAQPAGGTFDVCACGHRREQHIYHEGACRPGFACPRGCEAFVALSPAPVADAGGTRDGET